MIKEKTKDMKENKLMNSLLKFIDKIPLEFLKSLKMNQNVLTHLHKHVEKPYVNTSIRLNYISAIFIVICVCSLLFWLYTKIQAMYVKFIVINFLFLILYFVFIAGYQVFFKRSKNKKNSVRIRFLN